MDYNSTMMIRKFAPVLVAGLALTLTACGGGAAEPGITEVSGSGKIVSFTTTDGLNCDVFDTSYGGGVDCNFEAFTAPADWKPGQVESLEVADGTASVAAFEDGHYCVTFDGMKSGGITCAYPAR